MKTPIADFVRQYAEGKKSRFHMPGHKGVSVMGCEALDITEVEGADVLSVADGIIGESEKNAAALFGSGKTLYTTGGSSACIAAMLAIAAAGHASPRVIAARNVHKSFVHAAALLDIDVEWLFPTSPTHLCQCPTSPEALAAKLEKQNACAVYVTSPDYLGYMQDIAALAAVCHAHGVPLLVDNAHGAYLAFTDPVLHPLAEGADMCCDSAHKTLPVLTGGAYLHIHKNAPAAFFESARRALSLFTSTSPSYLVLQSLDLCNEYLASKGREGIPDTAALVRELKARLEARGFVTVGNEPLKLTLNTAAVGLDGEALAGQLRASGIEPELADATHVVLMCTPALTKDDYARLEAALPASVTRAADVPAPPASAPLPRRLALRAATLAPAESTPLDMAVGKICAAPTVACPPAVPIVMCGEEITPDAVALLRYYGYEQILTVKSNI